MQTDNRFLDDLAKLATGAAGAINSAREEARANLRAWLERQLSDMELVTREEFEVVRDMAARAREENDALSRRIAELESVIGKLQKASPKKSTRAASGRKSTSRPGGRATGGSAASKRTR